MKKILLVLIAAIGSVFTAQAQLTPVPNASFEFWDGIGNAMKPTDWKLLSGMAVRTSQLYITNQQTGMRDTVRAHSGNIFLGLRTDTLKVNDTTTYLELGVLQSKFQFSDRPNYFSSYLMYTPASTAGRFGITIILKTKNNDTVLSGLLYLPNESTMYPFSNRKWDISGLYRSQDAPDSAIITLISDVNTQAAAFGTTLWVDNMGFSLSEPTGILEPIDKSSLQNATVIAYPNPMTQSATITYSIAEKSNVKLIVTDITGREVAVLVNGNRIAGTHQAHFERNNLKAGIYLYRLQAGNKVQTGKLIIAD